jgi:hypothetical protein
MDGAKRKNGGLRIALNAAFSRVPMPAEAEYLKIGLV